MIDQRTEQCCDGKSHLLHGDDQLRFLDCVVSLQVSPGETALAFYTATNPTDKPVIGISTYNVLPYEAGAYFNKIQVKREFVLRN